MPSSQLTALLGSLANGVEPTAADLTVLSGLDTADIPEVAAAWGNIPTHLRQYVIDFGVVLAESTIDLEFHALACCALGDAEPAVRRSAIAALWEDDSGATAARIATLLRDDESDQVRAQAADSLRTRVQNIELGAIGGANADTVIDALRGAATDPSEPVDVRANAVESLGYRSLPWVETLINDAYYSEDRRLHLAGIVAMGNSAEEKWVEYLEEDLASDDAEVRGYAAAALAEIASEEAVDTLARALDDEDLEVQLAVIAALGEIGGDEAIGYLTDFAEEAPEELQRVIADAIENAEPLTHEQGGESLIQL